MDSEQVETNQKTELKVLQEKLEKTSEFAREFAGHELWKEFLALAKSWQLKSILGEENWISKPQNRVLGPLHIQFQDWTKD